MLSISNRLPSLSSCVSVTGVHVRYDSPVEGSSSCSSLDSVGRGVADATDGAA